MTSFSRRILFVLSGLLLVAGPAALAEEAKLNFVLGGLSETYVLSGSTDSTLKYAQSAISITECRMVIVAKGEVLNQDCVDTINSVGTTQDLAQNSIVVQRDGRKILVSKTDIKDGKPMVTLLHGKLSEGSLDAVRDGGTAVFKIPGNEFISDAAKALKLNSDIAKDIKVETKGDGLITLSGNSLKLLFPRIEMGMTVHD